MKLNKKTSKTRKKHINKLKLHPFQNNNNRLKKIIKRFDSKTKNKNPEHSKKVVAD